MKRAVVLLAVVALAGCAQGPRIQDNPEAMEPLVCANKTQCDAWWQRSQSWVAQNSYWKIQTASDAVIQTYGPGQSRVEMAYNITRSPNADGSARITISAACDNIFGCTPKLLDAVLSFKRYVKGG